ncbi:DUF500-domain-containing protein [Macroventuria anomochaeta]|uniref:DUF500-domain-containing protein n=1 Tax=Macroventuria anomochaeta TaxID=301207 RepID=A0ACB6S051_9PLEO|nr:DUF500-domain-containing protein [Macroventuria anomochaeta]KAF2627511.1 DUF500-domain-containing protein [Macroventuria anomochaeta]
MWSKTKTSSKAGFDKVYTLVDKLGAPVNRLSNKVGSEAFWPTTLDIESDKAARILKSFCSDADSSTEDGFYQEEDRPTGTEGPKAKQKVLKKIPSEVIKNAKGLCIFTTMRTGLWVSGSGGAGILVGRKEDGTWSPPSGIMMHTVGVGFLVGVDIYDCVIVINSQKALEAFQSVRYTLGGEISAVAGPAGVGGIIDTEVHKRQSPLFTYIKSRGFYAGLQLDGTIVIERTDENERFYGERIGVKDILAGRVRHPPYELNRLMETLKSAQGDTDVDESLIPDEAPPADFEVTAPTQPEDKAFGIPADDDPDPFGLLALQSAGLEIREAGTHNVPTSEQFEFRPSPTSPIFSTFRKSTDRSSIAASLAPSRRSSWRSSTLSSVLGGSRPRSNYADSSTQTSYADSIPPQLPPRTLPRSNDARTPSPPLADIPETNVQEATPLKKVAPEPIEQPKPSSPLRKSIEVDDDEKKFELGKDTEKDALRKVDDNEEKLDEIELDSEDEEEEVVIHEVHQAAAPQVINRARIIQVAKPVAPMLPPRNPFRNSRNRNSTTSEASTERGMEEKPSPTSTPSLRHGDSTSSLSSIEGEGLAHISARFQPKSAEEQQKKSEEKHDDFHSLPESPVKTVPGAF